VPRASVFLSCVFINFIFVFLTSGQDCNCGMQKRIHFRTDMEHNICRPVNNSDVSLGYEFCENITFMLYIIYNVRYNNKLLSGGFYSFTWWTLKFYQVDITVLPDGHQSFTCWTLKFYLVEITILPGGH